MKKLVSILLALAMILAMATTAFAEENTTLTIAGTESRTYSGYRLLELTTSLKCDHAEGDTHSDTCYNYSYTVNEKYRTCLQNEAFDNALETVWSGTEKPASASDVTDEQILGYLETLTSDSNGVYGTLRPAADRIYRAIQADSIAADKSELAGTENIDQGYWLFADVTNLGNQEEANSLVVVDTKGQNELTITPKVGLPTIEKKVKDTNDSTGETTDWQDSADHDIGDKVPFKLTATLPSNVAYYDTYQIVFHDTLSDGLTLDVNSIKVYMFENKAAAEADVDLTDNTEAPDFTVTTDLSDGCTFEVKCDNVRAIQGVTKDTVFVVYYEATLNANADIGLPGNPNEVYLEFSNNPYTDGTGKTEKDEVIVYTYQLTINKTDVDNKPLTGAGFTLSKKDSSGQYIAIGSEMGGKDTISTFEWKGLDDGDYKLVETTVPAGYNKMNDIEFTISANHESDNKTLSAGDFADGVVDTGIIEKSIVNKTGTVLPETGAEGTIMLLGASSMLVMVAAVFMVTRKKMSIYED